MFYPFNTSAQTTTVLVTQAVCTLPKWQFASTRTHLGPTLNLFPNLLKHFVHMFHDYCVDLYISSTCINAQGLKPRLHIAHFKRARPGTVPGTEPGSVPGPDTRLFTLSGPGTAPTRSSICGRSQFASCRACADRFSSISTISQMYTMASLQQLRK